MKAVVEDISTVKKKIRIEIPPADVAKEREKAIADISRKVKIPGFRPGKAPKAVVERHYGGDVQADVMHRLITDAYFRAVQENDISPVNSPEISDVSSLSTDAPLSFIATVEIRPAISLGTYDGIEVADHDVKATDEEVEQTINRLRQMYANLEVVEGRPAEKGDSLVIDFEGIRDGKLIEGAKATDYVLTIGEGTLLPDFEDQLVGMNKGDSKQISVTFPSDYANKDLAGAKALFTVALKEIKRAVLPEVNDDFAKDLGEHQSVDELRARIREDIEARKRDELSAAQREELVSKLVDNHSFEVPPSMVEGELTTMFRQQAFRMYRQGADPKGLDEVKFREANATLAERRVKGVLLISSIAAKENVIVSDEEVSAGLVAMARQSGKPLAEIRKYYESLEGGLENLRSSIRHDKALALLLSRANKRYN
jgi:trigger factor